MFATTFNTQSGECYHRKHETELGLLALNSGIGFFSAKATVVGDQGFWEA